VAIDWFIEDDTAASLSFVTLSAAGLTAALYWLFFRHLRRVNEALAAVVEGDLAGDLPAIKGGELGDLVHKLGLMVRTLRENYDDLKRNDDLRRSLIANVSHELRTPLTSIQGYLETARAGCRDQPQLEQQLDICYREARKLSRLVQDLFELSKLDTQHLEFHFERVSLTEIADQVGLAFTQRMADKQLALLSRFPDDDPLEVHGDGNRLGQVISNLLGNASVFTRPGGTVTLICERAGGRARLSVADTGIGIPPADLPHIFESFFRLEKSRTRNLGGTGLGLAICKAIVDAHGGTIGVESRVGVGTTFTLELDLLPDEE
jgi:signal transduction histidine kinase